MCHYLYAFQLFMPNYLPFCTFFVRPGTFRVGPHSIFLIYLMMFGALVSSHTALIHLC